MDAGRLRFAEAVRLALLIYTAPISALKDDEAPAPMNATRRYTSRKLMIAMLWACAWTALLWHGKLTESVYESLMWLSVGGYLLADVAEKKLVPPDHR